MEGKKNNKVVKVIILIVIIIVCIGIGIGISYFFLNKQNKNKQENSESNEDVILNSQVGKLSEKSFSNMKSNNEELGETQKEILEYFDNDYFEINSSEALQKYPQVFKGAKLYISPVVVRKIIKSTDEEYEVLVSSGYTLEGASEEIEYALKGTQLEERLIEGDSIEVYGKYTDINTYQADGKSYTVPTITPTNIVREGKNRFDFDTISKVAKTIFGNDIKITEPVYEQDFSLTEIEHSDPSDSFYLVTLDNQSNANFKVFDMFNNRGYIGYNRTHNKISENVTKKLFISADFEHYIVTTYDDELKMSYMDYFDKDLKKLWSREFEYKSTNASINSSPFISTLDYDTNKLAFVVDNDMYLIDIETGENIIEPVIVGTKIKVNMFDDGIVLIGNENKDTIMKVDFNGNILYRIDADTSMTGIDYVNSQIVNNKLIVRLEGRKALDSRGRAYLEKYIVLNNNGNIEYSTNETEQ